MFAGEKSMKLLITKTVYHTIEIDPEAYVAEFPVEYRDWLGADEPGYDGDGNTEGARREFVADSAQEFADDFIDAARLDVPGYVYEDADSDIQVETL